MSGRRPRGHGGREGPPRGKAGHHQSFPPRDTVLGRLRRAGLQPRKALGQHFLHDPKILADIAASASLDPLDAVLEVGTGPATLTREIASRAGRVLTVELDPAMLEFARGELAGFPGVRFLSADALDGKGGLNPLLLKEVEPLGPFKLVSNLPYAIATPLILALVSSELPLRLAVATIQREVAARMAAPPGGRRYGPLTALLAFWAGLERVRPLPPGAFWPPPAVSSEVVRIRPRAEPLGPRSAFGAYRSWVHRLFSQRRKQIGGLLREVLGEGGAREALGLLGLPPTARPEEVPPEGYLGLATKYPTFEFDTPSYFP